jgi:tetratricopeptide (TPR) repeat protein
MHRYIAETFEGLAGDDPARFVDELAAHWAAGAASNDVVKAVDYARRAGRKAAAGLAFESAATHYARAIEAVRASGEPHDVLCCDLSLELGNAQRSAGDARFRQTMADAATLARRLGDADRFGRAALGSCHPGGLQWSAEVDAQLVALYSEALTMLEGRDDSLVIRLLGLLAVELRFGAERPRAKLLAAQALAMARRVDDRATLARTVSAQLFVIDDPSSVAERLELSAELEALADALNDAEFGCLAAKQRSDALLAAADIEAAELALARCEHRAAKIGVPFYAVLAQVQGVMFAMMRGDRDVEARSVAAFEAGTRIQLPHTPLIFNTHMLELRTREGRLEQFIPLIRATVAALPLLRPIRASLAHALCEVGELTQAQAALDELAEGGLDWPIDATWAATVHLTAEACVPLGDQHVAGHLYPQLLPFLDQVGLATGMRCDGALAHPAGQLATCLRDYAAAEAHFSAALTINERIGARVAATHTRRAHAEMLIARGRAEDRRRALGLIAAGETSAAELDVCSATMRFAKLREALATSR